jgi:putative acetyltransferase
MRDEGRRVRSIQIFERHDMTIREETEADFLGIAVLTRAAFGGDYEVLLIEELRRAGHVIISLVAIEQDSVVGHILFSELDVEVQGRSVKTAALAPVAVRPERQREGIGSKLVETGVQVLRDRDYEAVIVLGHPNYYPRFGFSAITESLVAPFHGKAFMGLELVPGSLSGRVGSVKYPEAFGV